MCPCVHAVSCFIYLFLPAGSPFFWLFQTPDSQVVLSPCLVKIFPGPKIKAFLFLFLYGQARTTVTKLRLVKTSFGPHLYIGPTENSHLVFFFWFVYPCSCADARLAETTFDTSTRHSSLLLWHYRRTGFAVEMSVSFLTLLMPIAASLSYASSTCVS